MNRKPMKSPRALGRKAISQTEKFWIPENLKLEWILKQNPPEFKFRRDKALYLLNYIVTIDAKCPHFRTKKGLIRLSSKILEQSVKDYNKYMEYFEATGIIVCDHKYQKGLFCKGYMLAPEYDERPLKQVSIESGSIARPLLKKIESSPRQDDLAYSPLRSSLERVRIDKNAEIFRQVEYQLLIENPELAKKKAPKQVETNRGIIYISQRTDIHTQNRRAQLIINMILNQEGYLTRDEKAGRIYNPVTQCPKMLRNFLTIDNEYLVEVDCPCSQPSFLILILSPDFWNGERRTITMESLFNPLSNSISLNNKIPEILSPLMFSDFASTMSETLKCPDLRKEVEVYKRLIQENDLYDVFGRTVFKHLNRRRRIGREKAKNLFMRMMYSANNEYLELKGAFCLLFPRIAKILHGIKSFDYKILAILLQAVERHVVLDRIGLEILTSDPQIPFLTVHDAILTTRSRMDFVKCTMESEMQKILGFVPLLRPKFLGPEKVQLSNGRPFNDYFTETLKLDGCLFRPSDIDKNTDNPILKSLI